MLEIRSYRRVFDLERRIYRVDGLRLNPGGIPVRGVVYFLAILVSALLSTTLPVFANLAQLLPWYLRDLALPSAGAAVLTMIRIEGRPFHLAAGALVRYTIGPRRLADGCVLRQGHTTFGERWYPREILVLPDGSDARMRRLRYTGPGAVLVTVAHERVELGRRSARRIGRGPALAVRELPEALAPAPGEVIALARGSRLLVGGR
ncbi:MAG TPA: hypothetical protein VGG98_03810 [Solirubrobacteraceae bacterium]|jgi:hypothetical protein